MTPRKTVATLFVAATLLSSPVKAETAPVASLLAPARAEGSVLTLTPQPKTADSALDAIKKQIQENATNKIPSLIPSNVASQLGTLTKCDPKTKYDRLAACKYYSCYDEVSVSDTLYQSQSIVYGVNDQGICVYSEPGRHYFIPATKLAQFAYVMTAPQTLGKTTKTSDGQTVELVKHLGTKDCAITLQYSAVQETPKSVPQTKLTAYSVAPNAPKECTDRNALIPYELEMTGLVQEPAPPIVPKK